MLGALWDLCQQFQNKNGSNLVGGKVYIYYQGRTALATTYHDEAGTVVNSNPVLLDNNGRATVFADTIYSYTIVVCDYYGKELFSQDITLHDAISTAEDVMVIGSDGSVKVDTTTLHNGVQYDLSVNTDIIATKKSVDDVKTDLNNLTGKVDNHTTQIGQIQEDVAGIESSLTNKKDKQPTKSFDGSATKTIKNISQNANGELNVEFEDIYLPQVAHNVDITSEDSSVNITATFDAATNTKTYDLSVDSITNRISSSDGSINVSTSEGVTDLTLPGDVVRDSAYTHIDAATANPLMNGTAAIGISTKYAREDHVHPSDTSKEDIANKTTVILGTSDIKYPTDKAVAEFVNSSIATNTANYISNNGEPFTSVEQLEAYSGPVTNNDYAFVTGTDSDGNTYYDRYKATVSGETVTWALEYRLNNSSFTAAQWSAINSGITSVLVAKIHTHSNKDVLDGITSSDVANWNNKQNSLTAGDNITIDGNTISSNQIFVATYGITKYAEIKAAYDAGKICMVFRNELYYYINLVENNRIRFISQTPNPAFGMLTVLSNDSWEASSAWLQSRLTFDDVPTAGSNNPVTSDGIKKAIVQADWNETNKSSDAFIKNKPYFTKHNGSQVINFKVCTVRRYPSSNEHAEGIEVFYRRGSGAVHGHLLCKGTVELYLERIGDVSVNGNTVRFYYVDNSSTMDIYVASGSYCWLDAAPLANMPKDRIDFTNFGTSVDSIPEGAVAINPVWVANSSASSGTAPVKVDAYGNLTAVPMDSTPTASSTNLMTSGAIKTALDSRIPSPTSTTGTQVLKCIDGVIQWVTE